MPESAPGSRYLGSRCTYSVRLSVNTLITVPGKLELPLEMHGVISHLRTCKPTVAEVERYQAGLLQSVELTEDVPWEPYSPKFAETEAAACAAHSVMALRVRVPHRKDSSTHSSEDEVENYPQRSPILMEHCVAVVSHLAQTQVPIELSVDKDLPS